MFLIQYRKGEFIDGNDIQWVKVTKGKVSFVLKSQPEDLMEVEQVYASSFVNNLQAINTNIDSVESAYHLAD